MDRQNSDEQLMLNLSAGDSSALQLLHQRHAERLYYFFYRSCFGDTEQAQDLVQDLFLKLFEKPDMYNPKRPFIPWMYSVAHNMLKNLYAKNEVRKSYRDKASENSDAYHLEEKIELNNECELIYSCLDDLSPEKKHAFILRFKEDMSIREIADIMSMPEGTIKSGLHYSIKKIKEKLADYGENR